MANQPAYRSLDGGLPQNIEAEQAVLGSLLIDTRAIERVAPFLRADDFYLPVNGEIYRAMLVLYEQDRPTDIVSLDDYLRGQGRLDDTGGAAYLSSLSTITPSSYNVEHYARIVERLAVCAGSSTPEVGSRRSAMTRAWKPILRSSRRRKCYSTSPGPASPETSSRCRAFSPMSTRSSTISTLTRARSPESPPGSSISIA